MKLEGFTAIVTGAASGIGEATAHRLAEEGASVLAVDVHERGEEVAEAISVSGSTAKFVRCDVSVEDEVRSAVQAALDTFGGLSIVVNNAGIMLPKTAEDTTLEEWDRIQAVNLRSVYLFLHAAAPHLRASGSGSVINVSSMHSAATIESLSAYAASKSGMLGITRSAALDLAPGGVRVNAVCPGIIDTAIWQGWLSEVEDPEATEADVLSLQPLGRVGDPREVANAILFLASEEASYITGTTLFVDGGVTARLSHV